MPLDQKTTPRSAAVKPGDSRLAARLRREVQGDVLFDPFSRGRYSTDASIYQIEPIGIVVPKRVDDIAAAIAIGREEGVPVLPRGGGTSQCGQTVGRALVVDTSKYLSRVLSVDTENRTAWVEPGVTLDALQKRLKPHGLTFPVDISTGSRATLGGMTGNNSCGARSIRYGNMVHNVRTIDIVLADGTQATFGEVPDDLDQAPLQPRYRALIESCRRITDSVSDELRSERWPRLLRRVGGYNLDMIRPHNVPGLNRNEPGHNMAKLLVGSEGTLGFFTRIQLDLSPIPPARVLGVCHFPTFYKAMDATQHIVKLDPAAVELVDRTMIELSREIAMFKPVVDRFVRGKPDAILLVEFAGEDMQAETRKLRQLVELMGDLGFPDSVVEATDPAFQTAIWEVRKQGLNIMMSMKGDGKPVSFIEDCAVPLEDLAEYTDRLTNVFRKYGTEGTWYAHASVGTLHVRPIINLKEPDGAKKMRAIAEEAFAMVREYKGSHSGEHGDGIVRSEFHEAMFGPKLVRAFEAVKDEFDPAGLFNPGKIVRPHRMDDRTLFRYAPRYAPLAIETALDWSAWGGFDRAAEMCNNNGECRKFDAGVMCPSYRATLDEQHLTRGRANTLRLALTGQLGPEALVSEEMRETLDLCVSCKGCKRECPTGVDMARMKIEVMHARAKKHGLTLQQKLIAYLPRYAPVAARLAPMMNLRDRVPALAALSERILGFSAKRSLPQWRPDSFRNDETNPSTSAKEVVLLVDTFTRYFEPENARAALRVLEAAGYRVHLPTPIDGGRPLCCGRTFLAEGLVAEARAEMQRTIEALAPFIEHRTAIVGLEPSCLLTFRDELLAVLPGRDAESLSAQAMLFEEFLVAEHKAGRLNLPLKPIDQRHALVHGHCHQKAFAAMGAVQTALKLIPSLDVKVVESSCCGMAGSFGYEAGHYDVSMKMAELSLLPAVRAASADTVLVADGTSCRHQIRDGANRQAVHVALLLERALAS
ncbi:MAG TPA: FAD-linked oxidase C-terminal domain-containing protein [Alphaproteobacteria bacterium]|nr:FAD-linked oxidase C-terminal domain-containing protein [Alphaproteobacteria bacterium]